MENISTCGVFLVLLTVSKRSEQNPTINDKNSQNLSIFKIVLDILSKLLGPF